MKPKRLLVLSATHLLAIAAGFAAGIYFLPILTAPPPPDNTVIEALATERTFSATFSRERQDSDALHWGEGELSIGPDVIAFKGRLAPGPDYRLYLSPEFVETEADFNRLKASMVQVGDVKTFENFIVPLSDEIDPSQHTSVIVWCESFGQFITSGQYQPADVDLSMP